MSNFDKTKNYGSTRNVDFGTFHVSFFPYKTSVILDKLKDKSLSVVFLKNIPKKLEVQVTDYSE